MAHFVSGDELPLAEELLTTIGARTLSVANQFGRFSWACVLWGDFTQTSETLRLAAESGHGLSVSVVDIRDGIEIYTLVRTRSSGHESEIYLAVLNREYLAASPDVDTVRDMIDRQQEGGDLPQPMAVMLEEWGLADYFFVMDLGAIGGGFPEGPLAATKFYAFHVTLAEESTATFRALQQFDDEDQAAAASAWLQEQTEPQYRRIGWGDSVSVDQWRRKGATVYAEATVPDERTPDLVQGH